MKTKKCATCDQDIFYITYHGGGKFVHVAKYDENNNLIQHDHYAREVFVSTGEFGWSEENGVTA